MPKLAFLGVAWVFFGLLAVAGLNAYEQHHSYSTACDRKSHMEILARDTFLLPTGLLGFIAAATETGFYDEGFSFDPCPIINGETVCPCKD